MPTQPQLYLQQPVPDDRLPALGDKWLFVGIDMAPIDTLETGIVVIDRNRQILRMDKLHEDAEIFSFLDHLGPKEGMIVSLDVPKSLHIPSKWRQQEVKMHPLRLSDNDRTNRHGDEKGADKPLDRFARRAWAFNDRVSDAGIFIMNYFTHTAKLRYELNTPYRTRSPQGCKALQALIKEQLGINHTSNNLAPSSVLDAMIGAYISWNLYTGKNGKDFQLYEGTLDLSELDDDSATRYYFDPLKRVTPPAKPRSRRRWRSRY